MDRYRLPEGVEDTLPKEMYRRIDLENRLSGLFFRYGYDPVDASVLENAETYRGRVGALEDARLFQLKDTDGSLVVLRADMTLPLSRIAATKLPEEYPLRLSYVSPSYALNARQKNRDREFRQAGVELFGSASPEADAEVVSVAIEALKAAGLKDFVVDMGQVGIVKGVLKGLPEERQLAVVSYLDKKNLLPEELKIDRARAEVLNAVVALYGDGEVLREAAGLLKPYPASLCALKNLTEVFGILTERGFGEYLSLDLGLVNSYSYYSGVVFKGLTSAFGDAVLGGGRYDDLLSNYGKNVPATGMSIGIRALLRALERQNAPFRTPKTDVAVGGTGAGKALASAYAAALRKEGLRVSDSFCESAEALKHFASRVGALRAVFFDADGDKEESI